MKAMALVIDERGASLELGNHDVVVVRHHDGRCDRVGLKALSDVVLNGDIVLSTGVLRALAAHGVALTCAPVRGLTPTAGFTQLPWRLAALRHAQHLAFADPSSRLSLATIVVSAKLQSMFPESHPGRTAGPSRGMSPEECSSIAGLMGVEGAATQAYYEALACRVTPPFRFAGRVRRPPRDPFNAMMSYACALAQAAAAQLLARHGLDLQIGFLHGVDRDRPSLALDLLEPARPVIDEWLIEIMCRREELEPARFTESEADGCRLDKEGRQTFLRLWFAQGQWLAIQPMRGLLGRILARLRTRAATVTP